MGVAGSVAGRLGFVASVPSRFVAALVWFGKNENEKRNKMTLFTRRAVYAVQTGAAMGAGGQWRGERRRGAGSRLQVAVCAERQFLIDFVTRSNRLRAARRLSKQKGKRNGKSLGTVHTVGRDRLAREG